MNWCNDYALGELMMKVVVVIEYCGSLVNY